MGRKFIIAGLLCWAGCLSPAVGQFFPSGARMHALAGTGLLLEDPWSTFYNQAGLAGISHPVVAAGHEMPFMTRDLSVSSICLVIPARPGVLAANYAVSGFSLWRESRAGISFARKFGSRFSAGLQLDAFMARVPEEVQHPPVFTFEAGILSEPVNNLLLAVHWFNPVRANYPETRNQRLPVVASIGAGYRFGSAFLVMAEAEKDLLYPMTGRFGAEYICAKHISLRYGYSSLKGHAAGIGLATRHLQIDAAFARHLQLGYTPSLSVAYFF